MLTKTEKYLEVSHYLEDEKSNYLLNQFADRLNEKKFYLPFIGQFSSGKSKMINNLLNRSILPIKGNETTALTTYITYSENEEVFVESTDHEFEQISFADLLNLNQTNINQDQDIIDILQLDRDPSSFVIEAIHVKLNHRLLKKGLVIVDTPGINTIIQKHEQLTYSILPEAQFLVYVLGKSLTERDMTIIKSIKKLGIDLIFVRTKLDDLKSNEETVEQTIQKDKDVLHNYFNEEVDYFGISNELEDDQWKLSFDVLSSFLNNLNGNLTQVLERSIEQRLATLKEDFERQLNQRLQLMEDMSSVSKEELTSKISHVNQKMTSLGRELRINEKELANQLRDVEGKVNSALRKLTFDYVANFRNDVKEIEGIAELQQAGIGKANMNIDRFIHNASSVIEKELQDFLSASYDLSNQKINAISSDINEHFKGSVHFNLKEPSLSTIGEDHQYVMEQLEGEMEQISQFMNKTDEELSQYGVKREEIKAVLQQMEGEVAATQEDASHLEYEPEYRQIEGTSISETLGKIGNVADWLLIVVPGTAIAKTGTKVAQIASKTAKTLKMGEKAIKTTKKVASTAGKLQRSVNKYNKFKKKTKEQTPEENANVLDLLTLEFWFKKAGSIFDTPPRVELDKNYQYAYEARKKELDQKYQTVIHKELRQLEELDLVKSKEDKLKKEKELKLRYLQKLEQDLKQEDLSLKKLAEKQAKEEYIAQLVDMFEEELQGLNVQIKNELETGLVQIVEDLSVSVTTDIKKQLQTLKKNLEELVHDKEKSAESKQERKQILHGYLRRLAE